MHQRSKTLKFSYKYVLHLTSFLKESENSSVEDSVSLNPSALIGQMAQSVVIGLPLTVHIRNKMPITIY